MLERLHPELLNFLARQLGDADAAADLAQESCLRVLAMQPAAQPVLNLRALLYRVARNLLVDRHRRLQLRQHEDLHALPEQAQPAAPDYLQPEASAASAQTLRAYVSAIEALPPRARDAFVLYVFDELSQPQIARRMGISVSMVEKHVARGLQACRACERRLQGEPPPDAAA